jgi:hypothetical protein
MSLIESQDKSAMPIPSTFRFSQGTLQDYVDCPRRFQLRYVLMQPWPALVTEHPGELEQHVQRGNTLHRLAHQYHLGLEPGLLASTIHDPILTTWWDTFLSSPPPDLPEAVRRAEVVVSAPVAGYRLLAKYDLLAVDPGQRLVIVDWKTVIKPPPPAILAARLQTRVYRFLGVEAAATYNGNQPPQPAQVEMLYWFAPSGGIIQRFPYDAVQHAQDHAYLNDLISEIAACQDPVWPLTQDIARCRFCNYRSLCDRGVQAGFLEDAIDDFEEEELEIDLEQIAEIAF